MKVADALGPLVWRIPDGDQRGAELSRDGIRATSYGLRGDAPPPTSCGKALHASLRDGGAGIDDDLALHREVASLLGANDLPKRVNRSGSGLFWAPAGMRLQAIV